MNQDSHKPLPKDISGHYLVHLRKAFQHPIFRSVFAYPHFLKRLNEASQRHNAYVTAYYLFEDEVIVLANMEGSLEHWIDGWSLAYSRWSHRVYNHQGSIFANQFDAVYVEPEVLCEAIRYVHQAGILRKLTTSPEDGWSSHRLYAFAHPTNTLSASGALINDADIGVINVQAGLNRFSAHTQQARRKYLQYMSSPISEKQIAECLDIARYGNHPHFRLWQSAKTAQVPSSTQQKDRNLCQHDVTLDQAVLFAQEQLAVPAAAILGYERHRKATDARALAVWLSLQEAVPMTAIEQYFETEGPLLKGQITHLEHRWGSAVWPKYLQRWQQSIQSG